jgi:hypothetical protein
MHVMHLNILKAKENGFVADLKQGDKVRIDDTAILSNVQDREIKFTWFSQLVARK